MTSTDIEMSSVAALSTPPPPSEPPRPENRTQFRFRAPVPEKKPTIPLEEVSLKPIALQFLKLRKNVHNLLQTCSEDSVNGEMVETINELKTTLKGFKNEFKKLPKFNDIRDEQQHRIAELLKQIQMKDEFMAKLIGPSLIKTEIEDIPVHVEEEDPQKAEEKPKEKKKEKTDKSLTKNKDKSDSTIKPKDKIKGEKKKDKTSKKSDSSAKTKPSKDLKQKTSKNVQIKIAENILISKSKKKPPIERRLVDPAKIKKLKEKIAEDKGKRAEIKNAVTKMNPEMLPKSKNISAIPKPSSTLKQSAKEKVVNLQKQSSTSTLKLSQQSDIPHTSQLSQKDQPMKDESQKDKSEPQKADDNKESKDDKPSNNEVQPTEETETQYPAEPPSPPIVKIMPLPGTKLRKPEPPIKTVVTFGRTKPMEKKEPPKNSEEPLKSALKKPEGIEEEPKQAEENQNQNDEEQEKKAEEEKAEKVEDDKAPATWKALREMFKKQKVGKNDKPDEIKKAGSSSKTLKLNPKLSKQYKLRKALKKLAKIQARQEKRKEDQKKKAEEKKKTEPIERMNIFKYYEDEKAKKKAAKMLPLNVLKKGRIVKKVVRKPISRNEQILRKIRRNAINNAQRDGYYTSPLLTIKYITELQNMIQNAEKDGTPLSSADFRMLRFKYFPCKDSELYTEKLQQGDKRPPISKHEIEKLRKINLVKVQNDVQQQNSNITYPKMNPRTVTDVSMRLPRREFDEEQLDQSLFDELAKMGF